MEGREAQRRGALELRVELDPRIHFAMQQNDVPVVKGVHIENHGEEWLEDVELRITTESEFSPGWSTRIERIAPGSVYNLQAVDLELSPVFLGALTERVRGSLRVELLRGGERLARAVEPVVLLAKDEWAGLRSLPELLAAFVLPNDPGVEQLLVAAARVLEHWSGDPSLSGYQSGDRKRVYWMVAATYAALRRAGISYVNPPASFEEEGQRVRLANRILESRMATCFDMALLAAGCLEQAGLHPLVILMRDHAFNAVWLHEEWSPDPVVDDIARLRKLTELKELAVFDATGVTSRPPMEFKQSVRRARRLLLKDDAFVCAIDIARARKGGIRPLPTRREGEEGEGAGGERDETARAPRPVEAPEIALEEEEAPTTEETRLPLEPRIAQWQRELLDLSLRNRLLNFRETKKSIPLLCPDLPLLEDMLMDEKGFQLLASPKDFSAGDPRDPELHLRRTGEDALEALLREDLKGQRLHAELTELELHRRLTQIYRAARLGLEESGASPLFLAIGFLKWFEQKRIDQPRLAPILLVPVELERKSVRGGFTLRHGDSDTMINVTLLELLRRDHRITIPELDPPPLDGSGLDVARILRTVRRAIRDVPRWEVLEKVYLGIFSFSKFLMWLDLTQRSAGLMRSPLVAHLVRTPNEPFDPEGEFTPAERLDDERQPTETYCPLSADSSQLVAIFAAADGRSFVLQGPPGTGKSQTIANLIAHCMAEGKSVLFVSEKMAALNVVHRRLVNLGLGKYCLELHSNKANKRAVMRQFEEALQGAPDLGQEEWERKARLLSEMRQELNAYVRALHRRWPSGDTMFEVTSRLIGMRKARRAPLEWESPEAMDADRLDGLRDLVGKLSTAGAACGDMAGHPWRGVGRGEWSPSWQEQVRQAALGLQRAAGALAERAAECAGILGIEDGNWSLEELDLARELMVALRRAPRVPALLLDAPDWDTIRERLDAWIARGSERDRLREELGEAYDLARILSLDFDELRALLEEAEGVGWPRSWWRRRNVRRALKRARRAGKVPKGDELRATVEKALVLRECESELEQSGEEARALLGGAWCDGAPDWTEVAAIRDWAGEVRRCALEAARGDLERSAALRSRWARLITEGRPLLEADARLGRMFRAYDDAFAAFDASRREAVELLELDSGLVWGARSDAGALERIRGIAGRWAASIPTLRQWCAWRRVRAEAVEQGLEPLVREFEEGRLCAGELRHVFERSYAEWFHAAVSEREPVLRDFFSPIHERRIEQFKAVDEEYVELTRQMVQARLEWRLPRASGAPMANSEMGILRRELSKKRRHISIRRLLQQIPNLLPRLKPCLLMSPISVAQYLDPGHPPFDVVVFDEASQIPVWDAIGAIARGGQVIIVGDPKQLPPTTFFERAESEEDELDEEMIEELESILDECIGARLPTLCLEWHYRSRHESLIAFSNHRYYESRLQTFPSAWMGGMGVRWRHVPDGVYDKGRTRTNRREAEEVVAEIVRRLKDPEQQKFSIGVVTFSMAQQTLIEDLLDRARHDDPSLEHFFSAEEREPVFVKNLENVQGDERDVIFFSIGYGPDANGRVSMNFGPLNRDGGERRLNVAITRARREVVVFSTLRAEQIDLNRTNAQGVRDLKSFLEFAERGFAALGEVRAAAGGRDGDGAFENAVYEALVSRGWEVHRQVGCARFKVDLAVVDPRSRDRYLLGILCDGENYRRPNTARDREKLRESVLEELGWRLCRIWSADWLENPDAQIEKLEVVLERAQAGSWKAGSSEAAGEGSGDLGRRGPTGSSKAGARIASAPAPVSGDRASTVAVGGAKVESSRGDRELPAVPLPPRQSGAIEMEIYRMAVLQRPNIRWLDFYDGRAKRHIRQMILELVRVEGPISLKAVARRITELWGFSRISDNAVRRIRELIPRQKVRLVEDSGGEFLWPVDLAPEEYRCFRVPGDGAGHRVVKDLPLVEIGNAAIHVLEANLSAPQKDLVREVARLFGFQRAGKQIAHRIQEAIEVLEQRGIVELEGSRATLSPEWNKG
jgi:very-short-patch-repair endonuclease